MQSHDQSMVQVEHLPPTPPSEPATDDVRLKTTSSQTNAAKVLGTNPKKHIWIITGPAGCGKTSVAEFLHKTYSLEYLEGDTFHTPENVKKMADGHPLTDSDRWDWLILLREEALKTLHTSNGVIVTCSALKRKYRDVIRIAAYQHANVAVNFIFLNATEAALMDRVRARRNHYMKDYMVHSQFESLETPQADEIDILSVDASGTSKHVQDLALAVVDKVMANDVSVNDGA